MTGKTQKACCRGASYAVARKEEVVGEAAKLQKTEEAVGVAVAVEAVAELELVEFAAEMVEAKVLLLLLLQQMQDVAGRQW